MKTRQLMLDIEPRWAHMRPPASRMEEVERDMANIALRKAAHDLQEEIKEMILNKVRENV